MVIKNNITGKTYPISKLDWEKLGKNQKLFTVVDAAEQPGAQPITNVAFKSGPVTKSETQQPKQQRPSTGEGNKDKTKRGK